MKLPTEIIIPVILLLDKHTIFTCRHLNKALMFSVNNLLFKNAFEYFKIHKLIFIYAYTIPFHQIFNECPYLRIVAHNLCVGDFKVYKSSSDPRNKKQIYDCDYFFTTNEKKPIKLLQRLDLLDIKKLSQNIFASVSQLKNSNNHNNRNHSFVDVDFIEVTKYLLSQFSSLKTIDISSNFGEVLNIDESLLIILKANIDKVNLFNYWYNFCNARNFIKNIKKVNVEIVIDFAGLNNAWSYLDENINEVEKILTSNGHITLKILLYGSESVKKRNLDKRYDLQKEIINNINRKLHKHTFKVTKSQEILFYKIGDNIQREVNNIICIYFNNVF